MRINIRRRPAIGFILALAAIAMFAILQSGLAQASVGRAMVWVDGEKFATVVTPATFNPESGNFDELYALSAPPGTFVFADGVPLISDSKPGDQDYNGGRWHLNVLTDSANAALYAGAMRVEDLDLSHFTSTDVYFECPLLPQRGNN